MARLPALIDVFVTAYRRPRANVEHSARLIREAGLIRTTKRGMGAAEMNVHDAVALLIGVTVAEYPTEAPIAVKRFRRLPVLASEDRLADLVLPSPLEALMAAPKLGAALEVLLIRAPDILMLEQESGSAFLKVAEKLGIPELPTGRYRETQGFSFNLEFRLPVPTAAISLLWTEPETMLSRQLDLAYEVRNTRLERTYRRLFSSIRSVSISVHWTILLDLHRVLHSEIKSR